MMEFRTDAERQRQRDLYYMSLAEAVRSQANCLGSEVGAVLVRGNRLISAGYNGTPAGFQNCRDGGCLRCGERDKRDRDPKYESPHPETMAGKALDICFCVHAEQNTLLNAARHGIAVEGAAMYVTHQPCFSCLKEAVQAGITPIAFLLNWYAATGQGLRAQYDQLAEQLEPVQGALGSAQIDREAYRAYREAHVMILDEDAATGTAPEQGTGG
jgi:dCMP deaminase